MSSLRRSQRLYVVKSQHKLPEIGGVRGPILRPMALSEKSVISMLNRGVAIYEVNPANYKEMTKVTFRNVHTKQYSTRNLGTSKGSKTDSSTPTTYNAYERVANTYGKSVRGAYGTSGDSSSTTSSTSTGISTDILTGTSETTKGKGRDLPKGKKTTVVEQSSEAATVKAEKSGTTTETKETAETTSLKSSDF